MVFGRFDSSHSTNFKHTNMKHNKFICHVCQTVYMAEGETAPQGVKWSDGHKCSPVRETSIYEYDKAYRPKFL